MATKVRTPMPADAQWVWITPADLDIQKSGEWAVKEQNREHSSGLKLNTIDESWAIPLASEYGNLYLLHLQALNDTQLFKYQAFVWAKPAEFVNDRLKLVSFKELSPASASA